MNDREKDLLSFIEDECEHFFNQATTTHAAQSIKKFDDISEHVYYASDMLGLIDEILAYDMQSIISGWRQKTLREIGERA